MMNLTVSLMPSEAYWSHLTKTLTGFLPPYLLRDAVRKARSHAAGKAARAPVADVNDTEYVAFLGVNADVLKRASPRQLGILHDRLHQIKTLEFSRLHAEEIEKAHDVLSGALIEKGLGHKKIGDMEELDDLEDLEVSKSEWPEVTATPIIEASDVLKADHDSVHEWAGRILNGEDFPYSFEKIQDIHDNISREMINRRIPHDSFIEKSGWLDVLKARQFFSSPGGKRAMASRVIKMMPEHKVYVEPFAGGAAVFFSKEPSTVEVLNDMDDEIVNAYQSAQKISDSNLQQLMKRDWVISRKTFMALRDSTPKTPMDKLYRFIYLKGASYGGMKESFQTRRDGENLGIVKRLPEIRERLSKVRIHKADAIKVILKYDSPEAFFFVDPPYPAEWKGAMGVGSGDSGEQYTDKDLAMLVKTLGSIKGKFLLTVSNKERKLIPNEWHMRRIPSQRSLHIAPATRSGDKDAGHRVDMEIIAGNYEFTSKSQPDLSDVHVPGLLRSVAKPGTHGKKKKKISKSDYEFDIAKTDTSQHLVWTVAMKPNDVDAEGQWASPETIMETAHRFLLKGSGIYLEHRKDISTQVKVVESSIVLEDMTLNGKAVTAGSWIVVLKILNDQLWGLVENGTFKGVSIRGVSKVRRGSPTKVAA